MLTRELCPGGGWELQVILWDLLISYRCSHTEHLGWSQGRVVKGMPRNFLTLHTGQGEKQSKRSE